MAFRLVGRSCVKLQVIPEKPHFIFSPKTEAVCTRSHALSELSVNGSHKGWLLSLRLLMEQRKQLRGSSTVEVISSQGDVDREEGRFHLMLPYHGETISLRSFRVEYFEFCER
ncbi:Uncharacterized protein Rs2_35968 [Raphanus sativus]|nr:Uncharacterized protein Rs2_35968 [Raphanus sativus]